MMLGQSTYGTRAYGGHQVSLLQQAIIYLHKALFTVYISFKKVFTIHV